MIGPSSQALQAVAQGSYPASQKVISRVVPLLLEQFHVSQQVRVTKVMKIECEMYFVLYVEILM